jgi:hypothetical protein
MSRPKTSGLRPGQPAEISGIYRNREERVEVTVVKGEPLPPTPKSQQHYDLVEPAKHRK